MKAFELLKFYTDGKVLRLLILSISLCMGVFKAHADEELGSLEVAEYQSCSENRSEIERLQRDLSRSCREADLGGNSACVQTLYDCEQDDAEENDQCLPHMTSESDVAEKREELEELREEQASMQSQIEEHQSSIVSLEEEAAEITKLRGEAHANLQTALAEVGNQRAAAQAKLNEDLQSVENAVDQAKDRLATLTFELREFTLARINECDQRAQEYNDRVYVNYQRKAARGTASSHRTLFSMTGLSVREKVRMMANTEMKRCMALRTNTTDGSVLTPYGTAFLLNRDKIRHQEAVINREIRKMNNLRDQIDEAHSATLASVSAAERGALVQHQNEVLSLNQRGQILIRQERQSLRAITSLNAQMMLMVTKIADAENELQESHGEGVKVATDDEVEAYREAQQAADSLRQASQNARSAVDRCNMGDMIAGILSMFETAEEEAARSVASRDGEGDSDAVVSAIPDTDEDGEEEVLEEAALGPVEEVEGSETI